MELYAQFFKPCDAAAQHRHAHALLADVLRKTAGITTYTLETGKHGKPRLQGHPDIFWNLSHCRSMALCGIGTAPLGVDGECCRKLRSGVVRRVCTASEAQEIAAAQNPDLTFTRFWTLKESFVKAIGIGISYPMNQVAFSLAGDGLQTNVTGAHFWQYVLQDRYVISACAAEPEQTCTLSIVR
jgi:4'-phosphopantetheinyl transferase